MVHYYKFNKDFKTNRRFKILSISDESLNGQRIDFDRINLNSVKFLNIEEDIHIIACWLRFETYHTEFLIEHESYPQVPIGAVPKTFDAKIVDCIKLVKITNKL